MDEEEIEAMRKGLDKCMTEILRQKLVIGKLISYLHQELGTAAATELLEYLQSMEPKK